MTDTIPVQPVNQNNLTTTPTGPNTPVMPAVNIPNLKPKRKYPGWLIPVFIFFLIFIIVFLITTSVKKIVTPPVTNPVPTLAVSTPSAPRQQSPLATSSAFLELESQVASVTAEINSYVPQYSKLSPPVLDLPLGFSN